VLITLLELLHKVEYNEHIQQFAPNVVARRNYLDWQSYAICTGDM